MRLLVAIALIWLSAQAAAQAPPSAFVAETVYAGSNGMISIEFDHQGRLLVAEKQGRIVRFEPNASGGFQSPPAVYADLRALVDPALESGLLGFVLDRDYALNRYLYLVYTTTGDQRVVRARARADFLSLDPDSLEVLLGGLPRNVTFHKAGDVQISPADPTALYVALGDDGDRAPVQNPDRYEGKFLRIDAATGLGLPDNPYFDGNPDSVRSRVWAIGLRNPFRFAFHPGRPSTSVLYASENGDATDRLSRISAGSNGAWGPGGDNGGFLNPPDPGHRVLFTGPPSHIGIAISPSGPFGSDVLYLAKWFPGTPVIRRFQLTGAALDEAISLDGGVFLSNEVAVDFQFGPDGHLYYSQTGGDASTGGFYQLRRIRFVGGSPPVAAFTTSPDPADGLAPLLVQFSDGSSAPGSTLSGWHWDFGDGATSSLQNPTHSYAQPGRYTVTLRVENALGLAASSSRTVAARRAVTLDLDIIVRDARTLAAPPLASPTELAFYEADGLTPLAVPGGSGTQQNRLPVPAGGLVQGSRAVQPAGDALVISAGEPAGDGVQAAARGLVLPPGSSTHPAAIDFLLSDTLLRGRLVDTLGVPQAADIGLSVGGQPYALPGGRDYLPGSGYAPTGVGHRLLSDATGRFHLPLRSGDAGAWRIEAIADTGSATHARIEAQGSVAGGSAVEVELLAGRWSGGSACDDLTAIAETPGVDYEAAIQPIWSGACTGCHVATSANNGGLDLTSGQSLGQLLARVSLQAPGVPLVSDGEPGRSYLFEKINCDRPQRGERMRPANPMPLSQQALVRDWIRQRGVLYANGFEGP
jgi:hypothetical protein